MSNQLATNCPEIWGGVECTVNRVGDRYLDQMEMSGHACRLSDIDDIASLGIRTIRYPVLWERVIRDHGTPDWSWTDARLGRLRELGIAPIVGLVHHGSGPRSTSLLDPDFPTKLAAFAAQVADRYPWVSMYTPVNEPLTTARFSGLYGLWYPHRRDDASFGRTLLNQCRAIVLSMRAIRAINPSAQLIGTEDLGKTHATDRLAYQAALENERRWVSYDLLCGTLSSAHPMWSFLRGAGIAEREIRWFHENACAPDILGFNHYLTSERFLDHRIEIYPPALVGGNGKERYVDVEAVRILRSGVAGPGRLLREAWDRFGLPLALTEVHNGCTREEQLRWLDEVWREACEQRAQGVDIRAVTSWALFGSNEWNSLVTRITGHYEPGAFDVRAPRPRRTAVGTCVAQLASGGDMDHPVIDAPGWWRRADRFHHPSHTDASAEQGRGTCEVIPLPTKRSSRARPILITGATGTLGRAFARVCASRGLEYELLDRAGLDIASERSIASAVSRFCPWAIVNTAGYVRVDDAEGDCERCRRENTVGPALLAAACADSGIRLVTFSSDLVFDGHKRAPYVESDAPHPLNEYGSSKAEAERQVLSSNPSALIIRTSAFFGPWDTYNFVWHALRTLARGESFTAAANLHVSPTYVPDLVHSTLELLIDGDTGIFHLANAGAVTWAELARLAADAAALPAARVIDCDAATFGCPAARPAYSVLSSERVSIMPSLENAISRFMRDCEFAAEFSPEKLDERFVA